LFWENTAEWWAWARQHPELWEFRRVAGKSRYVTFAGVGSGRHKQIREARAALRYPVVPYPKRP
jgi:hypothetical protein